MPDRLRFVISTPHETVFDDEVDGARVPAESGLVGLRPRGEPLALAVEPGLVVLHTADGDRFAATAGGLLASNRERTSLYTPFAVVGAADDVVAALDAALETPSGDLSARRRLGELEQRILHEIRAGEPAPHGVTHG